LTEDITIHFWWKRYWDRMSHALSSGRRKSSYHFRYWSKMYKCRAFL